MTVETIKLKDPLKAGRAKQVDFWSVKH